MKSLSLLLISAGIVFGQTPEKIITFNRADTEHCKVVVVRGKPLLQSTYQGTSVAIAMPMNRGNGHFSIFVAVSQAGKGVVPVNPKDFYGLYSDKDHTRFSFIDQPAQSGEPAQGPNPGMSATNRQIDPGSLRPGAAGQGGPPPGDGPPDGNGASPMTASTAYFRKGKVKPGSGIAGWITLGQTKGERLEVHPTDMLDEIDIPVNGVTFRF